MTRKRKMTSKKIARPISKRFGVSAELAAPKSTVGTSYRSKGTRFEHTLGFLAASIFSLAFYAIPFWGMSGLYLFVTRPFDALTWAVLLPIAVSFLLPPVAMQWVLRTKPFRCIPLYFGYQEVIEPTPQKMKDLLESDRPTLISLHPHGVFSMVAVCSAVEWNDKWWSPHRVPTAVADVILTAPLLKHVMGILGLTSASSKPLSAALQSKNGVILYPGGNSELFLTDPIRERLHMLDRKGFIRIALQNGCALVPGYLFGNTQVLKLVQSEYLRAFSRKTGVALTYLYGRFYLPLPLPSPCMTVIGHPLLLPKLENPTQAEIDHWHQVYMVELKRIYNTYRHLVPGYENKELEME